MIIGSGMLANAFMVNYSTRKDVCVYASGVSNSSCIDGEQFNRERLCVLNAIKNNINAEVFLYFGTCSIYDPSRVSTAYVQHKIKMEQYVRQHPRYLIIRLPQIAGKTSNSNALLNYLYSCISREETFKMWIKAKRNIISVDDVVLIVNQVIEDKSVINATINIANPNNYSMPEIIQSIENVTGKRASYEIMDSGDEYIIETVYMKSILSKTNVVFCKNYLENALREYYKQN